MEFFESHGNLFKIKIKLKNKKEVPTNELHVQGYVSIGCEPCTRPVFPNQHEREGRWWWEDSAGT